MFISGLAVTDPSQQGSDLATVPGPCKTQTMQSTLFCVSVVWRLRAQFHWGIAWFAIDDILKYAPQLVPVHNDEPVPLRSCHMACAAVIGFGGRLSHRPRHCSLSLVLVYISQVPTLT